jgi:hypothetical protein
MQETVEEVAEREFRFQFSQLNFFALHKFYLAIQKVPGEIVLESASGVRWTPDDAEHKLREHFSAPEEPHTARVRESDFKRYAEAIDKALAENPDYIEYVI